MKIALWQIPNEIMVDGRIANEIMVDDSIPNEIVINGRIRKGNVQIVTLPFLLKKIT